MIVSKAVKMAEKMNVPVLGLVENMSYFECPNCKEKHELFGPSRVDAIASAYGIGCTARIPIEQDIAKMIDEGHADRISAEWLDDFYNTVMEG